MKYFNKTHALILLIILLAFSQMTLHQKLEHLSSHLSSIQSEILNTRSLISSELYQLNQSESMYLFESFNVLTHELDLEKETLKLKFDLTFLKLPENGEVKIEISDKSERLYSSEPYGFEQSEASYTFKEIIVLEGDNNRYIGEMVLDLNRNYAFSLLVGDGGQQSKESLGTISALEWFKSPNTISVSMNGLSINAPSSGRFSFDLFIGNHFASDIYGYDYYSKPLFSFNALKRIPEEDFETLTYSIYYKETLLKTEEVTDAIWDNDRIKISDSVDFVTDIHDSNPHVFKFIVTLTTVSGETFESEYIATY